MGSDCRATPAVSVMVSGTSSPAALALLVSSASAPRNNTTREESRHIAHQLYNG